jgi:Fe-S oxidoreductase
MEAKATKERIENVYGDNYIEDLKEFVTDAASMCRNCNYCSTVCPLYESTTEFISQTPTGLMQSMSYAIKWNLFGEGEKETLRDLLYLCTTCNSCVMRCKAKATAIPIIEVIEVGKRILTESMIGPLPNQRKPLKDINLYGNPYGGKPEARIDWLKGTKVKMIPPERAEVLFYVGCTTSYEPNLNHIGKSLLRLFEYLQIDFGILTEETCCGEPARRMGDEGLFQEMRNRNLDKIKSLDIKSVVTVSPHCFNIFLNEYPSLRGQIKIQHYTQFLAQAFKEKKPVFKRETPSVITYHDPCYLGKHNQIFDLPRELLQMIPRVKLVEMKMTKNDSLCCGGGGGRMFAEVEEERRLSDMRVLQAVETGANVIATACPWCYTMLQNAVQDLKLTDKIQVKDIAEILDEALK